MNAILSADENWGIGSNNQLLIRIPDDMKYFRGKTQGKTIVVGRKTLESFPGGNPLPKRKNIVISRSTALIEGATICHNRKEAMMLLENTPQNDIFVVGGQSIYEMFLPFCHYVYVTKIQDTFSADAFFPNLDKMEGWVLESQSETMEYEQIKFTFCCYKNQKGIEYGN